MGSADVVNDPSVPAEQPVPEEALRLMASGGQLDYDPGDAETGEVLLGREPQRVALEVDSDEQDWADDDPHAGEKGHYAVVADSLVASCEDFDPLGLLVWLPLEGCFGSWDSDHWDLVTFPGAAWADIALDPPRYLNAVWDPTPQQPYLVPVSRYPFVDEDGTVHPPPGE